MKKKLILLLLFFFVSFISFSQTVDTVIEELITELTLNFSSANPNIVFKPNLAVVPVENNSPSAKKYEVGPAFTAIIESMMNRSLIFGIVDEKLRNKAIDEIKFSLSGLAESERLEIGEIELVDYFLAGQVTELGEEFRLSLKLIAVESGSIVDTVEGAIPKKEVFETSQAFTAAYVSPYGIGIEMSINPWTYIYGETAEIEGQPVMEEYSMFKILLNYRVKKWLVVWGGIETSPSGLRFTNSYEADAAGVPFYLADAQNIGTLAELDITEFPERECYYTYTRGPYYSFLIGAGWVWNITKALNLTFGGTISMTQTFLEQDYKMPPMGEDADDGTWSNIIHSGDIMLFSIIPGIKTQYFITPRLALNAEYQFKYQIGGQISPSNYFYQDGEYGESGLISKLYKLDPRLDIDGNEHVTEMTGHLFSFGLGFYF